MPLIIWIFTEGEDDGVRILATFLNLFFFNCFAHRIQYPIPKLQIPEINIIKIAFFYFFSGVEAEDDYDFVLGQEDHPNIVVIH